VEIAAQHAKGQRILAGVQVIERLLLDGVYLETGDVAPGYIQHTAAVEAHLADAAPSIPHQAAMCARRTAHRIFIQFLV